jgi:hypothetical protein
MNKQLRSLFAGLALLISPAWPSVASPNDAAVSATATTNEPVSQPPVLINPGPQTNADHRNYAQAVGLDGPVSHWRLDGLVGTSVIDTVGTNPGTAFGGVTPGQPGALADGSAAMLFNGSTSYVRVPDNAALQLAGDLTLELWLNVSLSLRQTLISKNYLHEFELMLETDGTLNLYQGNGAAYSNAWSSAGAIAANSWHHAVVTREAATQTVRFYVDGVARGSGVSAKAPTVSSNGVSIGRSESGVQYANGCLEDVAVYPRALRPEQIALHYAMRNADAASTPVQLQLVASDPAGRALMFSATGLPPGLIIGATTGLVSGMLTSASAGTYHVTVTASNGSMSQAQSFTWTVNQAQVAPRLIFRGDAANPQVDIVAPGKISYRYSINGAPYSPEFAITKPISLTGVVSLAGRQFTAGTGPLVDFLNLKNTDDAFTEFVDHIAFDHLESQLQVTYMVNKLRTAVEADNVLNLRGAGAADLNVTMHEKGSAGPRFELSALAITGGELSKTSSAAGTKEFVVSLPQAGDAITVTPQTNNDETSIVINGQAVNSGQTISIAAQTDGSSISLRTVGPNGAVTSYSIKIRHAAALTASPYRSFYLRAFTPASAYVSLQNVGTGTVTYGLTFNKKFGTTAQGIIDEVTDMPSEYEGESTPRRVWRFIRDNRYHFGPLTRARWNQSPALFFSSIGFGFCDDAAALFYHLSTAMGYPARVWNLSSRHSVPEAFVNNRWELWDPDLQVYYQNRDGLIAGVEQLASDTDLVTHPITPVPGALGDAYSAHVAEIYGTRTDTYVVAGAGWLPLINDSSMLFTIPAGGTFEFPDVYEAPLSALDLVRVPSYANARLIVPEGFSGSVSMPLVVQSVGWSNNPRLSVITRDGSGNWDSQPTVEAWGVDVEAPFTVATQPSGAYNANEPVTLTAIGAAAVYYTRDGSTPTEASSVYGEPVAIAAGDTVKFFGVDSVGNVERVRAYGPAVGQAWLQMSSPAAATVTFSARASGGVGSYEFSFRMYDPRTGWSTVRSYSESDNWVWNRTGAAAGRYTVEVLVRNRGTTGQLDTSALLAFDVAQDAAPILTNPGNQTSAENANISLQLAASDSGGDVLTYGAIGLPASLTVNKVSGLIAGTLSFTSAGSYVVTATVSDGGLSSSQVFTWSVGNTNRTPILTNPGDQESSDTANYRQAVLTGGPAAYWRLDETAGPTAASSAGTSPGTLFGGATLGQPGALADGTALRFDGSTGYVQVANSAALQLAGDLTIELWLNVSLATRQTLVSKDYLHEFELTLETDGRLNLYQGNGSTYGGVLSALAAVTANTWQHVVVTRTAATKTTRFYVNGIATGSGSYALTPTPGPKAVSIGRSATDRGMQYVNGRLDEVALYPAALTPAQIATHYALRTFDGRGAGVALQLSANDPDGDALTYSATGLPPGLAVNAATGLVTSNLPSTSGAYQVTATVSDGNLSNSRTFIWMITHGNGGS